MILQNWILPLLIGIVAAYLLMSILYNNSPQLRQSFSDLGALIQLQTSGPAYYVGFVPENQSVYNSVVGTGGEGYKRPQYVNTDNLGYLPNPYISPSGTGMPPNVAFVNSGSSGYMLNPYLQPQQQPPSGKMNHQINSNVMLNSNSY